MRVVGASRPHPPLPGAGAGHAREGGGARRRGRRAPPHRSGGGRGAPQKLHRVATSTAVAGAGVAQAGALLNCAERFLTALDAVQLQLTAVDQMYPLLLQVAESLDRVTSLPPSFEGKATVGKWLTKLKTLPATYQLNEDEVRQLTYDLNMVYLDFRSAVGA
eukprot:TRINITY_DN435_c0_g1_i5.p3 TRINITY_DN435_c0_g1~~TRINITY_DN435_c0_g1_i5.p3  ORF type:complete len:162 (-),score=52.88 TRINITY_DN435_c0_g1_i5:256-741(-)